MKIGKLGTTLVKSSHRLGFWVRRNSPELLLLTGIVSAGAAVVLAVKATTKLEPVVETINNDIKVIKDKMNDDELLAKGEYSLADGKKELTRTYLKAGLKVGKLYAYTGVALAVSVGSMLGSHKILKGRNIALAAAYTTLENGYKNYRKRVQSAVGEKVENEIYKGYYGEDVEVITVDKNGNEKVTKKKVNTAHMGEDEGFSYLFDASNPDWNKNSTLNINYLLGKERYLNQKLISQGYLFLSDVYNALGIEPGMISNDKLQASKILGWIYDPSDDTRDNYVSFGLADAWGNLYESTMTAMKNGERNLWLEFNPDGDILTGKYNNKTFMKYARSI